MQYCLTRCSSIRGSLGQKGNLAQSYSLIYLLSYPCHIGMATSADYTISTDSTSTATPGPSSRAITQRPSHSHTGVTQSSNPAASVVDISQVLSIVRDQVAIAVRSAMATQGTPASNTSNVHPTTCADGSLSHTGPATTTSTSAPTSSSQTSNTGSSRSYMYINIILISHLCCHHTQCTYHIRVVFE